MLYRLLFTFYLWFPTPRWRIAGGIGILLVAAAMCTAAIHSATAAFPSVGGGKFEVTCKAGAIPNQAIDAIVAPGAVSAHLHTFFGSKATSDHSTPESLQAAVADGTTCAIGADHAAYWIPTACKGACEPLAGGDPTRGPFSNSVTPTKVFAYYFGVKGGAEQPFPAGMQIIAGNAMAQSPAETVPKTVLFSCGNGGSHSSPNRTSPYACTAANGVRGTDGVVAIIKFPYCLDSVAGFSYGVDGGTGVCPAGTTTLGQLQLHVHYGHNTTGMQDGSLLHFSSGPYYTFHGDWQNGWDQAKLAALVSGCLAVDRDCGFLTTSNRGPGS